MMVLFSISSATAPEAEKIVMNKLERKSVERPISRKNLLSSISEYIVMDGLMDIGHSILLISSFNKDDLAVGDIIVYSAPTGQIIHRIIKIIEDEYGRLYTCKGDNNPREDVYQIRNENIGWLMIGIIY